MPFSTMSKTLSNTDQDFEKAIKTLEQDVAIMREGFQNNY